MCWKLTAAGDDRRGGERMQKHKPTAQVANALTDFQGVPYILATPGDISVFKSCIKIKICRVLKQMTWRQACIGSVLQASLALGKTLPFLRSKVSQAIVSSFHLCLSAPEKPLVLNVPGWIYLPLIVYPENHRWYVKLHLASFT